MDSELYNDFNAEVYGDLNYLFNESDMLERAIVNYSTLNNANINSLQNEINALKARIKSLKLVMFENSNVLAVTEQFNNMSSLDVDKKYYVDRDGSELLPIEYRDSDEADEITLPSMYDYEDVMTMGIIAEDENTKLHRPFEVEIAQIKVLDTYGGIYNRNIEFGSIVAQDIVNIPYTLPDGSSISGGAITLVEVILSSPAYVNTIKLNINSVKPISVSKIFYYDDNMYFTSPGVLEVNKEISDRVTLNITPTRIKRFVIPMQQKNYEVVNYEI